VRLEVLDGELSPEKCEVLSERERAARADVKTAGGLVDRLDLDRWRKTSDECLCGRVGDHPRPIVPHGSGRPYRHPRRDVGYGPDGELQSGPGPGVRDAIDSECAPILLRSFPSEEIPAPPVVDEAMGLDLTAANFSIVTSVLESQHLTVAASGGEDQEEVHVHGRAAARDGLHGAFQGGDSLLKPIRQHLLDLDERLHAHLLHPSH